METWITSRSSTTPAATTRATGHCASSLASRERIRQNLAIAQAGGATAPFTASFGVSDTARSRDLAELISLADAALLQAKSEGHDRVVIAGRTPPEPAGNGDAGDMAPEGAPADGAP